jgi:hypothetical protein
MNKGEIMQRYTVNQFGGNTFVVIDHVEQREICLCSNYYDYFDAENRARVIAALLNQNDANSVNP